MDEKDATPMRRIEREADAHQHRNPHGHEPTSEEIWDGADKTPAEAERDARDQSPRRRKK